ncbi:MAG: cellobiose phosphorylase, partial [Planctomycetota bacterium]
MTTRPRYGSRMGAGSSGNIRYALEDDGTYRIDAYDESPAFSSFLPGIAGLDGVPLWCMYVNRAQAVVSFGVESKDRPIAEFLPTPWAYQLVGVQGFRTFCKVDGEYYEPFQELRNTDGDEVERSMRIGADRVAVSETNREHGLHFEVEYFSPVDQPIGSLVRRVSITNSSGFAKLLSVLDGLPVLFPSGVSDHGAKALRRIHEAYATVSLAQPHVPFYSTRVVTHDEAEVVRVDHGNFYAAWVSRDSALNPVEPLVDPDVVFGAGNDLITPRCFISEDRIDRARQTWENRLPCALVPFDARIE